MTSRSYLYVAGDQPDKPAGAGWGRINADAAADDVVAAVGDAPGLLGPVGPGSPVPAPADAS